MGMWFGKPRDVQNSQRGEGGVGFLVRDCLVNEVEFVSKKKPQVITFPSNFPSYKAS